MIATTSTTTTMSSPFIKRARSKQSVRSREDDGDDAGAAGSPLAQSGSSTGRQDDEPLGSVMQLKMKKHKEKKAGASRLSFGGDADEESSTTPFKPKKSLLSQALRIPTTPAGSVAESSADSIPSVVTPSYSREYLSELKAATPSKVHRESSNLKDVESDDDDAVDENGISKAARSKYGAAVDTTAGIPSVAAIASAKAKRQAALKNGGEDLGGEDFISLGNGQMAVYDSSQGPHPESRLQREEDEEGEGDEDMAEFTEANTRMPLGKNANRLAARRLKGEIGEMIDEVEADLEDDEEANEWELAQIRRSGRMEEPVQKEKTKPKTHYQPTPIPTARAVPTIASAQARLAQASAQLEDAQAHQTQTLERAIGELSLLEKNERELREGVSVVEGKREWVEEFRGWVEMLGGFLEEKFPKLEDIEADTYHQYTARSDMVTKRRAADDSDDMSLFLGVAPGAPTEEAEEQVDELGRVRKPYDESGYNSGVRKARRSDRLARRQRRRAAPLEEDDGYSTDSTLGAADSADYQAAQASVGSRVEGLLGDVKAEDFRDPNLGLAVRFGDWRTKYDEEYRNAFGGLAMVQAWEFYARGEMVGWDPLRSSTSLESFRWFQSLYQYSRPRPIGGDAMDIEDDEEADLGSDGDLVAAIVSSSVTPLVVKALESGSYDPYSIKQTRKAIDLADVISELTGRDSAKFKALLRAVLSVFHEHLLDLSKSVSDATHPDSAPPPPFDPASRLALLRYVRRRTKLLKNISLWRRYAAQDVRELITRLVTEVLRPVLSRSWEGGGSDAAKVVLLAIPPNTIAPDLASFLQQGPSGSY